ncbi:MULTISPECIES: DUF4407 domain-containing protein [Nocardiopsidaceae]|uniref:DUF4407 domain-containing protein n=1 Tax=Streptomonospora nanhaiensis TaxID=1323731 RepID=A0ABY6YM61_9ACTN|nr:DUF4407 domain-containing protein [Streptomonospora nanhaiensis]WAE73314.1 DUF4407 domain-containing protein [Streptomonospora nanhaiensis]
MTHSTVAPPEAGSRPETAEEPRLPPESRPYRFRAWTSRVLRRLTGVDEDLLDEVPEERPRYTLQGLVVVCTSLLAGIAVFVALGRFTDTPWPLLVPAAAFWAGLILVFDCWMLSTMHGVKKGHRFRDYTGRIILAVLVSVVVAEPLLLYVFRPSVEQEIRVDRQQEEAAFRSSLERCNPVSGEQSTDPSCTEEFLLTVGGSTLAADRSALAATVAERDRVQEHVDSLRGQLEEKQELARLECNGSSGDGLTGRAGEGVNCRRLRGEADAFEEDSRLSSYQANLLELDSEVEGLTSASGVSTADFASARGELIDEKVADRTAAEGEHGIIDEMEALGELARGNFYVMAAVLLLRLLLVAVDLFPVLTKVLGGASKYDELYTARADFHRERHGEKLRIRRKQLQVDTDRDVGRLDAQQQADRNENDRRMRSDKVRQRAVLEDEIARQASQYRGQRGPDGEG